jgi:hypothetical protein
VQGRDSRGNLGSPQLTNKKSERITISSQTFLF